MEQRDDWQYITRNHVLNHVVVVLDTLLVYGTGTKGEDSRPTDTEAVSRDAQRLQAGIVDFVVVVRVRTDVTGGVVHDSVHVTMGNEIPNGRTFAICIGATFDLESCPKMLASCQKYHLWLKL